MINATLVLEGGALRGIYTAGVLDVLLQNYIEIKNVAGVSAGALNAMNYISKQEGRSARINLEYCRDPQYIGVKAYRRSKGIIGFDYLFDEISHEQIPFDHEKFKQSKQNFYAFATNCLNGETEIFEKSDGRNIFKAVQASSSMPMASAMVKIDGIPYLDGAISTSIPIEWALQQKEEKIIVVLTRDANYRKKILSSKMKRIYHIVYRKYPQLLEKLETMPERYNQIKEEIGKLEQERKIFVIKPRKEVTVSRLEKNVDKLRNLYQEGIEDMSEKISELKEYLKIK